MAKVLRRIVVVAAQLGVRTGRERRAVSAVSSGPPHAKTMTPCKLRKIFAGRSVFTLSGPRPRKHARRVVRTAALL